MKVGKSWLIGRGPDRILTIMIVIGGLMACTFLYGQTVRSFTASRSEISRDLNARAAILDSRLHMIVAQLDILRAHADQVALTGADAPTASSPLLTTFLDSNPTEANARLYSLDRLPPPYEAGRLGNMVGLTTQAASRRPGLSRPDSDMWLQDAALGVSLLPIMASMRATVPDIHRVFFGAATGVVAFAPWEPSAASDLLDNYSAGILYRAAIKAKTSAPLWSLLPASGLASSAQSQTAPTARPIGTMPEMYSTVALPLFRDGTFSGLVAAQINLPTIQARLGPTRRPTARLLLVDLEGRILSEIQGEEAERTRLPIMSAALMAELTQEPASHDGVYLTAVRLKQAPLVLIHAIDRKAVLLPTALGDLASLGLLTLLMGLVVLLGRRMMRRALADREAAIVAERSARAASDQALSDLRAAHDELDFLNREKTRFFSLISHDLRGPFNALLGMTQELAEHGTRMKPEDVIDFARSTHQSARKVFDLLENLLQWSRVQMSGKPFAPSVFALRELVADALRDVQSAAEGKAITMLDAVGDRWVLADRTMILAVLRNLLVNAVKFSHPGGLIHITSRALSDQLEVAVTDQGIGMEPDQVRALLRPSAGQVTRPGTQGEVGTGLGLTLVRDLVLRHGGELRVSSEPGNGTVVSFTVPLVASPTELRRTPLMAE